MFTLPLSLSRDPLLTELPGHTEKDVLQNHSTVLAAVTLLTLCWATMVASSSQDTGEDLVAFFFSRGKSFTVWVRKGGGGRWGHALSSERPADTQSCIIGTPRGFPHHDRKVQTVAEVSRCLLVTAPRILSSVSSNK
jgi:hypothetical protein